MSDNKPEPTPLRNGLAVLAQKKGEIDPRLSPQGRVLVGADLIQGKAPRFHDGMSLEDAVIITGLPREEALRRIREMHTYNNPEVYAASRLSAGAGEKYAAGQAAPPPAAATAEVVQLPLWAEPTRGTPNSFLRGALFAAIHGKEREYFKGQLLASRDGIKIRFTGMQLDQSDLEVWEEAVQLARSHPLGNVCQFTIHGFLKALGRPTGRAQHEWLRDVLCRLAATCAEITHGRYTHGGGLLEFIHDEEVKTYALRLNPTILSLYKAGWTAIDRETRRRLRRKPLALWLHGYLSSDAENYDTKIETLHRLSGSKTKELKHFKMNLKTALAELEAATDGRMKGTLTGELVSFERQPTAAQARHLVKKTTKDGPRRKKLTHIGDLLPLLPGKPPK